MSVCLSVRGHSHGRISSSIITKIGTEVQVRSPNVKTSSLGGGDYRTNPSLSKLPFQAKRSWKSMQIVSNPIYVLNIRELLKFSRRKRNRDRVTRCQILDRKLKHGRFAHVQ